MSSTIVVSAIFCLCFAASLISIISGVHFEYKPLPGDVSLANTPPSDDADRIVNGRDIKISQAPYFIQISNRHRELFCGGTLLSTYTVLTAAHCVIGRDVKNMKISAGASKINEGGQVRKVVEVKIHPDYNRYTNNADVAILKADRPFDLNNKVKKTNLCRTALKDNEQIHIVGWGQIKEKDPNLPKKLQSIHVAGMSFDECARRMNITKTMSCSKVSNGMDACQGDSGGPVVRESDGCLVGVVSWGKGCGRTAYPGVLTNVFNVRRFIRLAGELGKKE